MERKGYDISSFQNTNRYIAGPVNLNGWDNPNNLYWRRPACYLGPGSIKHTATEFDLVREVLFLFIGTTSTIFEVEDNVVVYKHKYSLEHLSDKSLKSLMGKFAILANEFKAVADYTKRNDLNNVTMQAFQAALIDLLKETREKLSALEKKLRSWTRENPDLFINLGGLDDMQDFTNSLDTVSLIWLYHKLDRLILPIRTASGTLKALKSVKEHHSCFVLNHLFEMICLEQEMNRETELETYLQLFVKSMMPLMCIIGSSFSSRTDAWRRQKDFFMQINPDCYDEIENRTDRLDWATCCSTIPDSSPSFLKPFLDQFLRAFRSCLIMNVWVFDF